MGYPRVIIIGGGFGGLNVALGLKRAKVEVTLIDKTNHHLFQPLLYQVAGASLAPRDIAYPIREILKNQINTSVLMNKVIDIDRQTKTVTLVTGEKLPFDYLVVATGAHQHYFGHNEWAKHAPGLKSIADALKIRREILIAYERAENADTYADVENYLTFVIIGGGPTGVEMAGTIGEIAHKTLMKNFRKINPSKTRIFLVEAHPHLLPPYPRELGEQAQKDLENLGVTVLTGTHVTSVTEEGVQLSDRFIKSRNIIWAAGNQAPQLLEKLNTSLDSQKRAIVEADLSIPGDPSIFVIGDSAHAKDKNGEPLPGIAPVAIQQGHYVAKTIRKQIKKEHRKPFVYFDKGSLATIGRAKAVGMLGKWKLTGFMAWCVWSLVHIAYLVGFRNRMIVMLEWMFWYITDTRSSRLILETYEKDW